MSLQDRIALVTGGGSGIGQAVARLFAKEGAKVIVADFNSTSAEATAASLHGKNNHLACYVDVSKKDTVEALAQQICDHFHQPPSIVVHCAGVFANIDGLFGITEENWDYVININLKGTYLVNQKFAALMKEHNVRGSIVNISSLAAGGSPICPDYSASKAGVAAFTKGIAQELASLGIRVNCLQPGVINTPMIQGIGAPLTKSFIEATPMKRSGEPEEVAELCLFLATDRSSYIVGAAIPITGGLPM